MNYELFSFSNDGETVAQREDDALDSGIGGDEVVEIDDSSGLGVLCVQGRSGVQGIGNNVTVPKGVVGDNKTAGTQVRHHGTIVVAVVTLVGIDKNEVKNRPTPRPPC